MTDVYRYFISFLNSGSGYDLHLLPFLNNYQEPLTCYRPLPFLFRVRVSRRGLLPAQDELQEVLLVPGGGGPRHGGAHLHLPHRPLLLHAHRRLRLQEERGLRRQDGQRRVLLGLVGVDHGLVDHGRHAGLGGVPEVAQGHPLRDQGRR